MCIRDRLSSELQLAPSGHYEGRNVLHFPNLPDQASRVAVKRELQRLRPVRDKRQWPLIDQKILVSWNALMITSLAKAGLAFDRRDWIASAEKCAHFILDKMRSGRRLYHCVFGESRSRECFLEDYAFFGEALLDLFEATSNPRYFDAAQELSEGMLEQFFDEREGGFWSSSNEQRDLLMRSKEIYDGAIPSAYHVAVSVLFRLTLWTGDSRWSKLAEKSVCAILGNAMESPGGFQRLSLVVDEWMNQSKILIAMNPTAEERQEMYSVLRPRLSPFDLRQATDHVAALVGKYEESGRRFWLCELGQCSSPADSLKQALAVRGLV